MDYENDFGVDCVENLLFVMISFSSAEGDSYMTCGLFFNFFEGFRSFFFLARLEQNDDPTYPKKDSIKIEKCWHE